MNATLNSTHWARLTIKQKAARVMAWWSKISKEQAKKRCMVCGDKYPCDEHNAEP